MTETYRSRSKPLGKNFGRRNQAVVPVGAWVEIGDSTTLGGVQVFESAQIEEERIKQRQAEKEARLHQFQRDVRDRVREIHRQRRERQLQASSQAVDLQQRILINGGRGETRHRGRGQKRDEIYRRGSIQISSDKENFGDGTQEEGDEDVSVDPYQLNKLSERIGNMVKTAKRELASRKVAFEKREVPGGKWGESFTRDVTLTQQPQGDVSPSSRKQLDERNQERPVGDEPVYCVSDSGNEMTSNLVNLSHAKEGDMFSSVPPQGDTDQCQRSKKVTFDPALTTDQDCQVTTDGEKRSVKKRETVPARGRRTIIKETVDVRPGVVQEERKRQVQEEVLMYRRLFMDMERENVQENRRRKQHQKRIQRLKKSKEEERLAMERQSEEATEPKDPETGLTEAELMRERREDERRAEAEIERQRRKERKERETKRYIQALRAQMKEKMDLQGVSLPPLCPCSVTAWDCNPDTCANNCVFYKNPKAYAKALSSLLNSSEFG